MHPPLDLHLHSEECQKVIILLTQCHKDHPLRKFLGVCNELKRALNVCLHQEYVERRQRNYDLAQKKKKAFKKLYEE